MFDKYNSYINTSASTKATSSRCPAWKRGR